MFYINRIIMYLPEIMIATAILYSAIAFTLYRKVGAQHVLRHTVEAMFVFYVICVASLTLVNWSHTFGQLGYRMELTPIGIMNPYEKYGPGYVREFYMNMAMFFPLGFMLPLVFKKAAGWKSVFAVCFASTIGIESIQFFIGRQTDINDVIANFAGGAIGYLVILCLIKLLNFSGLNSDENSVSSINANWGGKWLARIMGIGIRKI